MGRTFGEPPNQSYCSQSDVGDAWGGMFSVLADEWFARGKASAQGQRVVVCLGITEGSQQADSMNLLSRPRSPIPLRGSHLLVAGLALAWNFDVFFFSIQMPGRLCVTTHTISGTMAESGSVCLECSLAPLEL